MTERKTAQTARSKIAAAIQQEEDAARRTKRPRQAATARAQKRTVSAVPSEAIEGHGQAVAEPKPAKGVKRGADEAEVSAVSATAAKKAKKDAVCFSRQSVRRGSSLATITVVVHLQAMWSNYFIMKRYIRFVFTTLVWN
jgi:poly-gamma-glutamate capsule biosynthesis protein CapA/YwtB (metallophosphatase superfamily)